MGDHTDLRHRHCVVVVLDVLKTTARNNLENTEHIHHAHKHQLRKLIQ